MIGCTPTLSLSPWERHLRMTARTQKEMQHQEDERLRETFLRRSGAASAAPSPTASPPPAAAASASAAAAAGGGPALVRTRSSTGGAVSTNVTFYGLEDETTNADLAAQLDERKLRLQVHPLVPCVLCALIAM